MGTTSHQAGREELRQCACDPAQKCLYLAPILLIPLRSRYASVMVRFERPRDPGSSQALRGSLTIVFYALLAVATVACSGKDKGEPFDRSALAESFCAAGCQLQVDCAPLTPPESFLNDCKSACESGFEAGTVDVSTECPAAAELLLGCVQGLSCDNITSGESYCVTEVQGYADACRPVGTDPCRSERLRTPAEPCCLDFGSDACESGLFCADFDDSGRATCYADHSRAGGESCSADSHCESGSCNGEVGLCRASLNQPCSAQAGCQDPKAFCLEPQSGVSECRLSEGTPGEPCRSDEDCVAQSGGFDLECSASLGRPTGTCVQRLAPGAACAGAELQCPSKMRCAEACDAPMNVCRSRFRGEHCTWDDECFGSCTGSTCAGLLQGEACDEGCSAECTYGLFCHGGVCQGPGTGDPCMNTGECIDNLACIEDRCASNRACIPLESACPAQETCVWYGGTDMRCAAAGTRGEGQPCSFSDPCGPNLICIGGTEAVCKLPCLFSDECGPGGSCRDVINSDGVFLGFALCI